MKHDGFPAHITRENVGVWDGCPCESCKAKGYPEKKSPMILHIKDSDPSTALHISHIHGLVSAYYSSPEMVESLVQDILEAQKVAKETCHSQVVDQAGHMFLLVHPSGTFDLCTPIRHFEFLTEEEAAKL